MTAVRPPATASIRERVIVLAALAFPFVFFIVACATTDSTFS